jgi:hypothetical protein
MSPSAGQVSAWHRMYGRAGQGRAGQDQAGEDDQHPGLLIKARIRSSCAASAACCDASARASARRSSSDLISRATCDRSSDAPTPSPSSGGAMLSVKGRTVPKSVANACCEPFPLLRIMLSRSSSRHSATPAASCWAPRLPPNRLFPSANPSTVLARSSGSVPKSEWLSSGFENRALVGPSFAPPRDSGDSVRSGLQRRSGEPTRHLGPRAQGCWTCAGTTGRLSGQGK